MFLSTSLYAYDVLDQVHVHVGVRERADDNERPFRTVFECTTTVPGTGESDPRQWAIDALVAILEAM